FLLEEQVGVVKCDVSTEGPAARKGTATFIVPRPAELEEANISRRDCADALNLSSGDIGFDAHRPVVASAGVPFLFVPVADLASLARDGPDAAAYVRALGSYGEALSLSAAAEEGDADYPARMFSPGLGTEEDAATGADAAAFPAVLMDAEARVDGHHKVR